MMSCGVVRDHKRRATDVCETDCETDGILGSTAVVTGSLQANEVLKAILNVGKNLNSHILIIDLLNLKFRKVLFRKRKGCICENI